MMKIGKILFGVSALFLANGMMAQSKLDAKQELDVNKQLQYCHKQVGRALEELKQKDGSFDYTMEPRNILKGDKQKRMELPKGNSRGVVRWLLARHPLDGLSALWR